MKKRILIIIVFLSIITIPCVKADECENLITKGQNWIKASTGNFILNNTGTNSENRYVTLYGRYEYTIFFDYGEENFEDIINTSSAVQNFQIWYKAGSSFAKEKEVVLTENKYTFKPELNMGEYYFRMNGIENNTATTPFIDNKSHEFWLVQGTEICRTKPEPEPEETVYSSFLTLYTDRLNYLAEGFTSNQYLIAMIGIIFGFIVLELFLKILHLRGGK